MESSKLKCNGSTVLELRNGSTLALTVADGHHFVFGNANGTRLGTATTQKLAFWNAVPVAQPAAVADATDAASVIAKLNTLLARLRTTGFTATLSPRQWPTQHRSCRPRTPGTPFLTSGCTRSPCWPRPSRRCHNHRRASVQCRHWPNGVRRTTCRGSRPINSGWPPSRSLRQARPSRRS
jgi:hypothetical protein